MKYISVVSISLILSMQPLLADDQMLQEATSVEETSSFVNEDAPKEESKNQDLTDSSPPEKKDTHAAKGEAASQSAQDASALSRKNWIFAGATILTVTLGVLIASINAGSTESH